MDAEQVQNTYIYKFITKNAVLMKLTTTMYLYETFYLTKNWGVTHKV